MVTNPAEPMVVVPVKDDGGSVRAARRRTRDGDIAISVTDMAKAYRIVHQQREATLAQEALARLKNPFRRPESEVFWALNGVTFDVRRGEVIGILGRNGSGKSTLLKLLSRITEPTRGRAELHGRVGSLLEVGTGFHPELTGRENVFLNGTILGMTRGEIARQFDAIVDYSGTEQFLDTPVKRYSSGMYVRLAFAVAAHLNPEILIVDEVLAVGDADFQKKCLGKMKDVARTGRTVLFVSHAMTAIQQLCTRCIYLERGNITAEGPTEQIVSQYLRGDSGAALTSRVWAPDEAPGDSITRMVSARIMSADREESASFRLADDVVLEMQFTVARADGELDPTFQLVDANNVCVFSSRNWEHEEWLGRRYDAGRYRARCVIPRHLLNVGQYYVNLFILRDNRSRAANFEAALSFDVIEDGSGRGRYGGSISGVLRPLLHWELARIGD